MFGAESSSKSNPYVYGIGGGSGCSRHRDRSCYICHRFESSDSQEKRTVASSPGHAGESFLQFSAMKMAHSPPGHHSVTGRPSGNGPALAEYVVYRGEQSLKSAQAIGRVMSSAKRCPQVALHSPP
ncbi:Tankyrase-2 [Collichthys lucidus]|uniref:Tankyrase-2 n=1 Tax=Collichthys lucidus TaxID=240159 RepID=A0A4U5VN57_COLLU|nr:Tankyrase-2 [Collichthys lucidus]